MNLSYSSLSQFSTCPLAWWFAEVVSLRPTEATDHKRLLGSAFHRAVERTHVERAVGMASPFCSSGAIDVALAYIGERITPDVQTAWAEEWGTDPMEPEGAERQLETMLEVLDLYSVGVLGDPEMTETWVEHRIEGDFDGDRLVNRIDLLYRSGGYLVIRDYKTSSRLESLEAVLSPQMLIAAWLIRQQTGEAPLWAEVVTVSTAPATPPELTIPSKTYPQGRLKKIPNRYTPSMYSAFCEEHGIEPDPDEVARLKSDAHVAKFITSARRLITPQALDGVERWVRWYRQMSRAVAATRTRPEGCRDKWRCGRCDYREVCRDLEDTGSLGPAEGYGMRIGRVQARKETS